MRSDHPPPAICSSENAGHPRDPASTHNLNRGPVANRHAARHGAHVTTFTRSEQDEISEIAHSLRDVCPVRSDSLEPMLEQLAIRLWRRNRLVEDLMKYGVLRARGRSARHPAPSLEILERLEGGIRHDLDALGMTLPAALKLGVTLKQLADDGRPLDLSRLTTADVKQLRALVAKAKNGDG